MAPPLPRPSPSPVVSVVLCTWNRVTLLEGALNALVSQTDPPDHEIVVVDNDSTDESRLVIERYAAAHPQVRYVFEGAAGLSHARNTGVAHTTGRVVAFTDDDVRVPPDWLRSIAATSERHPDAAFFGGPVLPEWADSVPAWLTDERWNALGAQSYGTEPFRVDDSRPVCLIGANLVLRRRALDAVGPFNPAVQRVHDGIGSTEDDEYHRRLRAAGAHGVYEPRLRVGAVITPDRLTKRYHRRWHFGHGRHIARMRIPHMERARLRILGIPSHLLRQMCVDALQTLRWGMQRDPARAFTYELGIWFTAGFIRERLSGPSLER